MAEEAGDTVERDEPLFEISTDKVDTEIPSPAAGMLSEVLVQEGQTVQVNAVVARITEGGTAAAPAPVAEAAPAPVAAAPAAVQEAPAAPAAPAAPVVEEEVKGPSGPYSPLVRKMARENNIDLAKVSGTGAGGRVTKEDVEAYLSKPAAAPAAPAPVAAPAPPAPKPALAAPVAPPVAPVGQPQPMAKTRVEPMSNMRQKIAEHMVMSKRVSAHVTTVHRVDMTRVAKMRAQAQGRFRAEVWDVADVPAVCDARGG